MHTTFLSIGLLSSLIFQIVYALLNEESAKEINCINPAPKAATNIDFKWASLVELWHFSHGSQLHMYRIAGDVNASPVSSIKEDEFYYDGCMRLKWNTGKTPTMYGFNGKKCDFPLKSISEGSFNFKTPTTSGTGTAHITLTDNKKFMFFYQCWDDNQASWAVVSSTDTLDEKTKKQIFKHAKSLGFDEKYFTKLRFETCPDIPQYKDEL